MKDKRTILILTLFFLVLQSVTAATHIYVSPSVGHDMNDGSKKRPLQSLLQALVKARQSSRKDTLFIHLADGFYQLDETLQLRSEDSGTAASPTVIVADHVGKVVFSGGKKLDMSQRMVSLNWWMGRPLVGQKTIDVRQLWRGDKKIPHASLVPLDSLLELSGVSRERRELWVPIESFDPVLDLVYGSRLGFAEDESIMEEVKREELQSMQLIACTEKTMSMLRVRNFQVDGKNVRLTFHEPESRLLFSQREMPLYFNMIGGYSAVIPGCWYQDPKDGSIVYDPDEEERAAGKHVSEPFIMPVLEHLVQVQGTYEEPVHHIIFRGITFEYTAWRRMASSGLVTVLGGGYLLNGGYVDRQEAAIVIRNAHNIEFANCSFTHIGATAIDYEPGCHHGCVTGCSFSDIGGSAIATPKSPADKGFRIQRNTFDDIANEIWFSDAIHSY